MHEVLITIKHSHDFSHRKKIDPSEVKVKTFKHLIRPPRKAKQQPQKKPAMPYWSYSTSNMDRKLKCSGEEKRGRTRTRNRSRKVVATPSKRRSHSFLRSHNLKERNSPLHSSNAKLRRRSVSLNKTKMNPDTNNPRKARRSLKLNAQPVPNKLNEYELTLNVEPNNGRSIEEIVQFLRIQT